MREGDVLLREIAAAFTVHYFERPQNPILRNQGNAEKGPGLEADLFIYYAEEAGIFARIWDKKRLAVFYHPADDSLHFGDAETLKTDFFLPVMA